MTPTFSQDSNNPNTARSTQKRTQTSLGRTNGTKPKQKTSSYDKPRQTKTRFEFIERKHIKSRKVGLQPTMHWWRQPIDKKRKNSSLLERKAREKNFREKSEGDICLTCNKH